MASKADIQALDLGTKNVIRLGVCPTRVVSMLSGISSGIEPTFSPAYTRRYRTGSVDKEGVYGISTKIIRSDDSAKD